MKLSYTFRNSSLQNRALTHRSAGPEHNERLEFLGDAILNLVVAEALYRHFPGVAEGLLSRLRAQLVCQQSLAGIARELELGEQLVLGSGEMKSGARRRDSILADALEALTAAIYLDSDMEQCRQVVLPWFASRLYALSPEDEHKDPKTALQEWLQARNLPLPRYCVLDESGPDNQRLFRVSCDLVHVDARTVAEGNSKKQAEALAAQQQLDQLKQRSGSKQHE